MPPLAPPLRILLPADVKVLAAGTADEVNLLEAIDALPSPVLIGWLRHYGCTLCKKQANAWKALSERVQILLIGNGTPAQAEEFSALFPTMSHFTDPSKLTYDALSFKKGVSTCLNGRALQKTFASLQAGNAQGSLNPFPKNATQQGGALVVDEAGIARFIHRDSFAGDHASLDTLESAIEEAKIPLEE